MVTAAVYAHDLRSKRRHQVQWIRSENDTPTIKCVKSPVSWLLLCLLTLLLFISERSMYLLECVFAWFFYSSAADPLRLSLAPLGKKQKLERIRLYFCQSFGWFFGWQNTNARYYFHFKWIYWLVLGEPTRIYGRLTYSILTVRRIVWWVFVETWDGRLWRRHETPNLKQTRERVDAIVLVSLQRIISGQSIFIKQHLPNNVINIEHDRWPNRWRRARDDSYQ